MFLTVSIYMDMFLISDNMPYVAISKITTDSNSLLFPKRTAFAAPRQVSGDQLTISFYCSKSIDVFVDKVRIQ